MANFETRLRLVSETNINIKNNTSLVTVAFDFRRADYPYSGYNLTGSAYWNITVDGQSSGNVHFSFNYSLSKGQWQEIARKTYTIKHYNDGSKTILMNGYINFGSGVFPGSLSGKGKAVLKKIPRSSTVSNVKCDFIGSPVTVNINRADNGFTHQCWYKIGDSAWKQIGNKHETSLSFTPPMQDCEFVQNSITETIGFKIKTFSGNTVIGSETYDYTHKISVPESVIPEIVSVQFSEDNPSVLNQFNDFVQNQSKIHCTIEAHGVYKSTIKKIETKISDKAYLNADFLISGLDASGILPVSVVVTDSRGRKVSHTSHIKVLPYHEPKISKFYAERAPKMDGADVDLTIQADISSVNGLNTADYKIEYRQQGTEIWSVLDAKTIFSLDGVYHYIDKFNTDNSFDIRLVAKDYFTTVIWQTALPTAFVLVDFKGDAKGIAFGKVAQKDGVDCDMVADFRKPVTMHNGENPRSSKRLDKTEDFNTLTMAGYYYFSVEDLPTMLNYPQKAKNGSGAVEVKRAGDGNQLKQIVTITSDVTEVWERYFFAEKWTEWTRITKSGSRILWQGAAHMSERDTITLSEPISLQTHGIVLVFCAYSGGKPTNNDFNTHFVYKDLIKLQNNRNHAFFCTNYGLMKPVASKLIKITDTQMSGNNQNKFVGDYGGLHLDGNFYVLRYVLGV